MILLTSWEKYKISTTGLRKRLVNVTRVLKDSKIPQSVFFISYFCDHKKPME